MRERTGETSEWRTTGLTLGEFAREGEILLELWWSSGSGSKNGRLLLFYYFSK